jgi:K+-transporting ATPase ATPase A chain
MTGNGWLQIGVYLLAILAATPPLGRFMTRVFNRERTWLDPVLGPLERAIYRLTGVNASHEMRWTEYAFAMLAFSVVSMIVLYLMLRTQQWLPWNPQHFAAIPQRSPSTRRHRSRPTPTGRPTPASRR